MATDVQSKEGNDSPESCDNILTTLTKMGGQNERDDSLVLISRMQKMNNLQTRQVYASHKMKKCYSKALPKHYLQLAYASHLAPKGHSFETRQVYTSFFNAAVRDDRS
ncbi:hypothetical protein HPP92_014928 [Vanilla planifolia]|uniref:Uncharacterized protein n=1 Tax=Vanilla planifolia TaxID=51239 RepID=A0A835QLC1_VANPL|nr:hypothetical protein HPP92_014928 [Vanilla planifolia]